MITIIIYKSNISFFGKAIGPGHSACCLASNNAVPHTSGNPVPDNFLEMLIG
jgi:hypothetical protein